MIKNFNVNVATFIFTECCRESTDCKWNVYTSDIAIALDINENAVKENAGAIVKTLLDVYKFQVLSATTQTDSTGELYFDVTIGPTFVLAPTETEFY